MKEVEKFNTTLMINPQLCLSTSSPQTEDWSDGRSTKRAQPNHLWSDSLHTVFYFRPRYQVVRYIYFTSLFSANFFFCVTRASEEAGESLSSVSQGANTRPYGILIKNSQLISFHAIQNFTVVYFLQCTRSPSIIHDTSLVQLRVIESIYFTSLFSSRLFFWGYVSVTKPMFCKEMLFR